MTPVAKLAPINIGGVLITRATLHNKDEIRRKDIREGDIVVVERAGDIIPKIIDVDKSARSRNAPKFVFPDTCYECGSSIDDWGTIAICSGGNDCPAQQIAKLKYSAKVLDIKGLGNKQIEFFYDLGLIKQIPDIFTLEEKLENFDLSQLKGWDKKSVSNLLNAINSRRTITLDTLISSLGILHVGPHAAKILAKHYGSYENWMAQLPYDKEAPDKLISIIGVGEKIIDSLEVFFSDEDNVEMVDDLANQLTILPIVANVSNSPLSGKIVVFTGKLSKIERNEAQALMESLGAIISSSVSSKTDFLVVGWIKARKS